MKKTSVFLIGIACCLQVSAQNNKVTSAKMHLDDFGQHQDTTELADAKAAIDEAAVNDKTKDEPKMYLYRGEIYLDWFSHTLSGIESKALASGVKDKNALTEAGYSKVDTSSICISANSLIKVLQLAPKDYYADEAKKVLPSCIGQLYNKALQEYKNKHYPIALALYKKLIGINTVLNISDSANMEEVKMAGLSADLGGNTAEALTYYQKTIDLKYAGALPYRLIVNIYLKQNDSAKAWDYIEKGRTQYPGDDQLIISETNFYIWHHDFAKAEDNLKLSITKVEAKATKDPTQLSSLYLNLGQIYDHRANPRDEKNAELPKPADYDDLFAKAEANYLKALENTPDNFDILFVTGALYYNRGVKLSKEADKIPMNQTDKYNKMMADAKSYYSKAQPYFEKAYKINPDDAQNKAALRQVYASTDQTEKAEALKK